MSVNRWSIQIFNENTKEYQTYFETEPIEIEDEIQLFGFYLGSSTRIGDLGTFYYKGNNKIIPKKIKIINNNNEVVKELDFKYDNIKSIIDSNNFGYQLDDSSIIFYRDLHRFDNYPFEISGIIIKKNLLFI
jgi:hypothetical protein